MEIDLQLFSMEPGKDGEDDMLPEGVGCRVFCKKATFLLTGRHRFLPEITNRAF